MSEENCKIDNIPTFIALPLESIQNTSFQKPEQFQIIKNAIIKTLSDGTVCIIDAHEVSGNGNEQIQANFLPQTETCALESNTLQSPQVIIENNDTQIEIQKPKPTFKCPKCKEIFDKAALYKKHMIFHHNVKKYKCDKCSQGYNVETNLKIHMAIHADSKPTCPICNITFQRLASLKSHLMCHQIEESYNCDECTAEFEKEEELNKHLQTHINNTVFEANDLVCSYCNVQFEDRKTYKEHIAHHIKVKKMVLSGKKSRKTNSNKSYPHVCTVCLKSFPKFSLLERHLRVHSGERPFVCQHCNKGFNQKGTLQIHLNKHTGIKPFQCALCSAKFNQKGNLRVHVEKTHTAPMPGVKMYKCPHCTCIFKRIASLNVHITKCHAQSEDMEWKNVMTQLKELELHSVSSSGTETIEGEVTEENRRLLNELKKSSDGRLTYVRLVESFLDGTIRRYLVMQKKINDVKWYICSYCSKEFKKPSDLIRHTRVHTRERPFVCKQCGASFALKSTLFYHMKTHISNTHFSYAACAYCSKKFTSVRSLNIHLKKHTDQAHHRSSDPSQKPQEAEVSNNQSLADIEIEMKQPLLRTSDGLHPLASTENNSKKFQCANCNARFSKISNLKRHMILHTGERRYKCDQCFKAYFTSHGLKEHLLHHSGVRNFGCKVCGKRFMTSSLLKRHTLCHSTNKPYVCPYCNKNFKSVALCRKHMNIHRKEIHSQLQSAGGIVDTKNQNNNDKLSYHNLENLVTNPNNIIFIEEIAPKITTCNLVADESAKSSIFQDSEVSVIPNNSEQSIYDLTPHSIQIITNSNKDATVAPNQIQTIFINCDDLQLSDNLYTQNPENIMISTLTDIPENNTFNLDNLEVYNSSQIISNNFTELNNKLLKSSNDDDTIKSKINETPLTNNIPELNLLFNLDTELESGNCDISNENLNLADINLNEVSAFNEQENTDKEEVAEKVTKQFSCNKCNKMFVAKNSYLKHLHQEHKDSKKSENNAHPCTYCSKIFKKRSDLVRHIRTHTGEKPFACEKCEKRFTLKSTLLSHQRTHNPVTQKQFNCVVCNSFFSSKSSLKVHMSVHTGDKIYECNFCSMKFRTSAHRKSHENNCHTNPSKKRTKNKVTNLLSAVAMDVAKQDQNIITEEVVPTSGLQNVLVVQDQIQLDPVNFLTETPHNPLTDSPQLDPIIMQQLPSNFLLQDNLLPSSLIHLDDTTLLNVKTVNSVEQDQNKVSNDKERNLECDICHKKYASKDVLRKHKKLHGVDKKFKCSRCEKRFDTEDILKFHEKTHDGFRPYSCLYCANSFVKEHSLATHMKRIHNVHLNDFSVYNFKE